MMDFWMVFKSLALALVLLIGMQYEWNGRTIESRVEKALIEAEIPRQLNQIAFGAIKATQDASQSIRSFVSDKLNPKNTTSNRNQPTVNADSQ